jgi:hypothetical protein
MIRVKEVIIIKIDGAKVSTVKANNTCKLSATSLGLLAASTPMLMFGKGISGAACAVCDMKNAPDNRQMKVGVRIRFDKDLPLLAIIFVVTPVVGAERSRESL